MPKPTTVPTAPAESDSSQRGGSSSQDCKHRWIDNECIACIKDQRDDLLDSLQDLLRYVDNSKLDGGWQTAKARTLISVVNSKR